LGKGKILIGRPRRDTVNQMSAKKNEPTFEQALEKLESLVASMESGDIPLADLVEKFEEGSKLVKTCEKRLKSAELKIEKLRKENDSVTMEAFTPEED
jgi:exodeoxyribonuclease VII small subunit